MSKQPLTLAEQGSFFVGGTVIQADGTYSTENPMSHTGQTFHGDHAYVSYQIPVNAHRLPLVATGAVRCARPAGAKASARYFCGAVLPLIF